MSEKQLRNLCMQRSVELVEKKEGDPAQDEKRLILPLVFLNLCVNKGVAAGKFGSVVSKGVASGRFRPKTCETRN